MMGGLRAFAQSWAGKVVLVFLAFLLLGSGVVGSISLFTSSSVSSGISAGGENINELEIAQEARTGFLEIDQTFTQVVGQSLASAEAFEQLGFTERVAESTQARLVNQIAFMEQAKKLGIVASSAELSDFVRGIFTDPVTGQFSERRMANSLAAQGLTERAYLREIGDEVASRKLFNSADNIVFDDTTGEAIAAVPSAAAQAAFNAAWGRYDVTYFTIDAASVEVPEATAADLQKIFDDNPDDYQRPEYRTVTGIFLTPGDLVETIDVSDEDIQANYDEYVARAEVSTLWDLKQLLVDDEATAQAIVDAVRGGETFEAAATANGVGAPSELLNRPITYGRDAINEAFTTAEETGMLDPIVDGARFALIEVVAINRPEIQTLDQYRDIAIRDIAEPQASTILSASFNELDGLVGSMTLEEAAAQANLPVVTATLAESGPDARVEGIPVNQKVSGEIFTSPVGQTGFRNTFGADGLFIVRVDAVEEARPLTFEESQEALTAAYTFAKRSELLTAQGETALAAATDLQSFADYVISNQIETTPQNGLTASELIRYSLPIDKLAGTSAGDVIGGVTNTGYNVVLVREARAADPELDAAALDGIEFQLARQYDDELQRAFRSAVRETVNVRVNETVFNRAVNSGLNAYLDFRSGGDGQIRLEGQGNTANHSSM